MLAPEEENISQLMGYLTGLQGVPPTSAGTSPIKYVDPSMIINPFTPTSVKAQNLKKVSGYGKTVAYESTAQ